MEAIKPSTRWFWLAGGLFAAGIAVAVVLFVTTLLGIFSDLDRFDAPGAQAVTLSKGDERAIYFERGIGGRCRVSPPVTLERHSGSSISINDEDFRSVFSFEAPRDATYTVGCETDRASRAAVGPKLKVGSLVARILVIVAAVLMAVFVAPVIAVVVAIMRHQAKGNVQGGPGSTSPPR